MSTRLLHDKFFRLAKVQTQQYVARSAYKLQDMQRKHRIIAPGSNVLDLGCAPGAWLQVACQALGRGEKGLVLGVDLKPASVPAQHCDHRVRTLQADVNSLSESVLREHSPQGFNAVLSDMCHATTGISAVDAARSLQLADLACSVAIGDAEEERTGVLMPGGHLLVKLLEGAGSEELAKRIRTSFRKVKWLRPPATRSESREKYLLATERL